jgi:hypothetical protein
VKGTIELNSKKAWKVALGQLAFFAVLLFSSAYFIRLDSGLTANKSFSPRIGVSFGQHFISQDHSHPCSIPERSIVAEEKESEEEDQFDDDAGFSSDSFALQETGTVKSESPSQAPSFRNLKRQLLFILYHSWKSFIS